MCVLWQHPFVDVFELVIKSWQEAETEGDTTEVLDKTIGKPVYKIAGSVSAANYLQLPKINSKRRHLGLSGRFMYVQLKGMHNKLYTLHLELVCNDGNTVRLTFSNLLKEIKSTSNSIQYPCDIGSRWTVLVLDLPYLLQKIFQQTDSSITAITVNISSSSVGSSSSRSFSAPHGYFLKSIQLCSNMFVRGVFTSDILYTPETLPREMTFRLPKDTQWNHEYEWLHFLPNGPAPPATITAGSTKPQINKEPTAVARPLSASAQRPARTVSTVSDRGSRQRPTTAPSSAQSRSRSPSGRTGPGSAKSQLLKEQKRLALEAARKLAQEAAEREREEEEIEREQNERERREAESRAKQRIPKSQPPYVVHDLDLEPVAIMETAKASAEIRTTLGLPAGSYVDPYTAIAKQEAHFTTAVSTVTRTVTETYPDVANYEPQSFLIPDPILSLRSAIGYGGKYPRNILFGMDNQTIFYTCASALISMNIKTKEQRFFTGHTADIAAIDISTRGHWLVSGQEGKSAMIRVWDTKSYRTVASLTVPLTSISSLSFSTDSSMLCAVGKDPQSRYVVIIWDVTRLSRGLQPPIIAKQISDHHINRIRFAPFQSAAISLVSCGKENIRFWRIKNNHIPSSAVVLNSYARDTVYHDLAFESGAESTNAKTNEQLKRIFACNSNGLVVRVNCLTRQVEEIYKLHDLGINSITVNEGFCVTVSNDRYLRVWPLDFNEFYLEAQHEGAVISVALSSDGFTVACGTDSGCIGLLDLQSHQYLTLLRSHTKPVLDIDMHRTHLESISDPTYSSSAISNSNKSFEMVTTSEDGSMRVFNVNTMEQLFEFKVDDDLALCVCFHPEYQIMACGFDSGLTRVFDVESTSLIEEVKQHEMAVDSISYSNNGRLLFSTSKDGCICIYDALRSYQPIKIIHAPRSSSGLNLCVSQDSSLFVVIGAEGRSVSCYETVGFTKRHNISCPGNHPAHRIALSPNGKEALVATVDGRLKLYDLSSSRQIWDTPSFHKGPVEAVAISPDGNYILSGGADGIVKVWDYRMRRVGGKQIPPGYQAFSAHSSAVRKILFTSDSSQVVSIGHGVDSICIWKFKGKFVEKLTLKPGAVSMITSESSHADLQSSSISPRSPRSPKSGIKTVSKDSIALQTEEDGFISKAPLSPSTPSRTATRLDLDTDLADESRRDDLTMNTIQGGGSPARSRSDSTLPAKQFIADHVPSPRGKRSRSIFRSDPFLSLHMFTGFNGRAHDNVVWHENSGIFAYSSKNVLVIEDLNTRGSQRTLIGHSDEISCLGLSADGLWIASASGMCHTDDRANIIIWDVQTGTQVAVLSFHGRGVQSVAFSPDRSYLVSIGNDEECKVVVWSLSSQTVIALADVSLPHHALKWNPYPDVTGSFREFVTVSGSTLTFWRLSEGNDLEFMEAEAQRSSASSPLVLTAVEYTERFDVTVNGPTAFILIGTTLGSVYMWNTRLNQFMAELPALDGEIDLIHYGSERVIVAGQSPHLNSWVIPDLGALSNEDCPNLFYATPDMILLDGSPIAMQFDKHGRQGVVGTDLGTIWLVNWLDKTSTRLVSSHTSPGPINTLAFEKSIGANLYVSASNDGTIRVWSSTKCEQFMQFTELNQKCLCVDFKPNERRCVAGYADGTVRFYNIGGMASEGECNVASNQGVTRVLFINNGETVLAGTSNGLLLSIAIESSKPLKTHVETVGTVSNGYSVDELRISPYRPELLLTAARNGQISVWDRGQFKKQSQTNEESVDASIVSAEDNLAKVFGLVDQVRIDSEISSPALPTAACFHGSDPHVILYCGNGSQTVSIRDFIRRTLLKTVSCGHVLSCIDMSPNTRLIAVGTEDRLVLAIDSEKLEVQEFESHSDRVTCVRFAPTGKRVLSCGYSDIASWQVASNSIL
eukprot:GILJ01014047.1.p1 GENE.GILJ01014047.1~~GILJ01014047.1.p1  ORF type:complete len:1899 (+),score=257.13 GILJ01014047.1:33-5729(+)